MTIIERIELFCSEPRSAVEITDHCKVSKTSIYSAVRRMQVKGTLMRLGEKGRARYLSTEPKALKSIERENLVLKHAHNPFGLRT